jgi:hypothetical protein
LLGSDFTIIVADHEPPKELEVSIRKTLQPKAVQILEGGKAAFEFWFNSELPLASKLESPGKALDAVKQTTLLGAVAVVSDKRDYKDNELPAGVYTMRFSLQPQDGNHLGSAEYPYFAVLVKAKNDAKLDGLSDYKALVKASSKETSADHPIILSLRPAASTEGDLPKLNQPVAEHKSVRVKIPAASPGGEKASIIFELVYQGTGKI